MAQSTYRALLQAESFPLVALNSPRTVIIGRNDIRPSPSPSDPVDAEKAERQLPATFYLENTLPTAQGFSSVTYDALIPAVSSETFLQQFEIRDDTGGRWRLGITESNLYIFDSDNALVWKKLTLHSDLENADWSNRTFSYAYAEGVTYFYLSNIGLFTIDLDNFVTNSAAPAGLDITKILGICASNNYLIAYDNATIYWSSVTNVLDLVPDNETGADSIVPNDLRGRITTVLQIPQGFIVYTTANAIAATYTNNMESPWLFKEVQGSSGVSSSEQVSSDENFAEHVTWSTSGLQQVSRIEAKLVFPEITDFLSGRVLDNPGTAIGIGSAYADGAYRADGSLYANGYVVTGSGFSMPDTNYLPYDFKLKIQLVGARYLVISYGEFTLTQCLVYDYSIKRWGKLNIEHVDVFEFASTYNSGSIPWRGFKNIPWSRLLKVSWASLQNFQRQQGVPRHNIAFLKEDGTVVTANLDESAEDRQGVLMLGRFQYQRGQNVTLEEVRFNQIKADDNFKVFAIASLDGNTFQDPVELSYVGSGSTRIYGSSVTGYNVSVAVSGSYSLIDAELVFTPNGVY